MVNGVGKVHAQLEAVSADIQLALKVQLEKEAEKLVQAMKSITPILRRPDYRRRAGALRDSIGWTWGDAPAGSIAIAKSSSGAKYGKMAITIYAGTRDKKLGAEDAFYAHFVEFGTQKMVASPFFFPVYRANKKNIRTNLSRAVSRAVKASKT